MGARTSKRQWAEFDDMVRRGYPINEAARRIGVSENTAYVHRKRQGKNKAVEEIPGDPGLVRVRLAEGEEVVKVKPGDGPKLYGELSDEARRAWDDFAFFQQRYFGRLPTPWQAEAAVAVDEWLNEDGKTFGVINAPPGCGKTTTFTHDIACWLTVRNRAIRGQMGSKATPVARRYMAHLKNSLTSTVRIQPEEIDIQRGLAVPAVGVLADDFGLFKPVVKEDTWSTSAIVVAQHGNLLLSQKEPTWAAYGQDSSFLGMRYDIIIWDDLVDKDNTRGADARQKLREWWDDIAEKRLEPGGLLLLQGQRMGPEDLYRYCLDKRAAYEPEDDDETEPDPASLPRKYKHIVYKAHYDDRCQNEHKRSSPYYPEGCLLDPRRLTWTDLSAEMLNERNNFAVIYQQEDVDPSNVLVNRLWITGGVDPKTGEQFPGCLDPDRTLWDVPSNLDGQVIYIATADPSPTQWWSCQLWGIRVVEGEPQERYLVDHVRRRMDAPAFLDWHNATQTFSGIMEDWQERSVAERKPITAWIVEKNGAQRFLLQYEHVRRWQAKWRTRIIPHNTGVNKADDEFGIQMLAGIYKYGLVRLPYKTGPAFAASRNIIDEVTVWPEGRTDDTVMAQWFLELNLPGLLPAAKTLPKMKRPSWLQSAHTWSWREEKVNS